MTLNLGLGTIAPALPSKSGERGGQSGKIPDRGFNEALAGKKDGKASRRDADDPQSHGTRPALERLATKLDNVMDERSSLPPIAEQEPAENFDAVLEGVLLDGKPIDARQPAAMLPDPAEAGAIFDPDGENTLPDNAAASPETEDAAVRERGPVPNATVGQPLAQAGDAAGTTARVATVANAVEAPSRNGADFPARQNGFATPAAPVSLSGGGSFAVSNRNEDATALSPQRAATRDAVAVQSQTAASFRNGGRGEASSGDGLQRSAAMPGTDALSARVNVLGFTAALAPSVTANPLLGQTAAGLVSAMEGDPAWRAAALEEASQAARGGKTLSSGVNTLRIQLHPVELGMVTARLTASGEQLSVEIQTETGDARQKLAADSESILKALRAVGYDVDKVTITQSPTSASGQGQQTSGGKDQFAPSQQTQGDGEARGREGGRGARGQENDGARHGTGEAVADRAGGSLYI